MHLGDPELAARLVGAADASLETLPIHYWAPDRGPTERLRRSLADRFTTERLALLHDEGAALTLEEAMLEVRAFQQPAPLRGYDLASKPGRPGFTEAPWAL